MKYWGAMSKLKTTLVILLVWSIMAGAYYDMVQKYEAKIDGLNAEISNFTNLNMTVTAYTASRDECNGDPANTATMSKPVPGYTVAVSRDKLYLLGRKIWVEGMGVYEVTDLMNKRFENRIDILVGSKETAKEFGVQERRVVLL